MWLVVQEPLREHRRVPRTQQRLPVSNVIKVAGPSSAGTDRFRGETQKSTIVLLFAAVHRDSYALKTSSVFDICMTPFNASGISRMRITTRSHSDGAVAVSGSQVVRRLANLNQPEHSVSMCTGSSNTTDLAELRAFRLASSDCVGAKSQGLSLVAPGSTSNATPPS
jgi:hypothetical protein